MNRALALAAGAAWALPALAPLSPRVADGLRIRRRIAAGGVALTFDDGPHPEGTPAVLDALDAAGAVATFFMVGERVLAAPDIAAEVVARGHAIGIHGHRHRNLLRVPPRAAAADLDRARHAIAEATGVGPVVHRPPYGIYSWPALGQVRARGWTPLLWSRWGRDWRARATRRRSPPRSRPPSGTATCCSLHDGDDYSAPGNWRVTVAALPLVFAALRAAGLTTVSVGTARL